MAWYAELKRRKWYCIKAVDMIRVYKKHLYDEWYNSLTEEEKLRLEEYRKKEKERKEREAREALCLLQCMTSYIKTKGTGHCKDIFDEIW